MGTKFNTPGFGIKAKHAHRILHEPVRGATHTIRTGWDGRGQVITVQGKFALRKVRRHNDRLARKALARKAALERKPAVEVPGWGDDE